MKRLLLLYGSCLMAVASAKAVMESATPESQGVVSQGILDWIDSCEENSSLEKGHAVHGFVIVRHGKVIAEGSWQPYDTLNEPHQLFSHSKSFTSTAVGFLVDDGKIDLDERLVEIFPEYIPTNPPLNLGLIRVRDLLTMNHGEEQGHTICDGGNWITNFMNKAFTYRPGTHFLYDSDATYILGAIVAKRSGKDMWEFLRERLFDKIGIEKATTGRSPQGIPCGGWGMNMTTREIARFGQLYLQKGEWEGEQLLSADWVTLATSRQTWSGDIVVHSQTIGSGSDWKQGYGFQFWRCRHGAFRADGAGGQLTVVLPEKDAVISVHAGLANMQQELNAIWTHLLPAMKDGSLKEDPVAWQKLEKRLSALTIPTVPGARKGAADVFGKTYILNENEHGLKSFRIEPRGDGWFCEFETPSGEQKIPVGFGCWEKGEAAFDVDSVESLSCYPGTYSTAASAAFQPNGDFAVSIRLPRTITSLYLVFLADGRTVLVDGMVRSRGAVSCK